MAADDNADRAYKQSRRAEVSANLDAIFDEQLKQLESEEELDTAAPAESPASGAQPSASAATAPATPAAQPAAAPASPSSDVSTTADVGKGILRGIPAFAADAADNVLGLLNEAADYVGLPDPNKNSERWQNQSIRGDFDKTFGKPETAWGQFAQDATGEIAALVPVLRGMKAAGVLKGGAQLFAADFAVTALGSNKGDQTLTGQAADLLGAKDNWFTDLVKNSPDDSTAERMIRTGLEGAFIGKAFDKAVDGFKFAHSWIKGRRVREAILTNAGESVDEGLETSAATVAQARSELEVAKAARESLGEAEAAQAAAKNAADEALRAEPIGMNRQPVMDASLSSLDENTFNSVHTTAKQRVGNLERMLDDGTGDVNDLAFKRDLIAAQDEFTAADLEWYRRLYDNMDAEGLAVELRQLAGNKNADDRVRALLIVDAAKRRGLENEMRPFMDEFAARSPEHAESLKGKLADVKQTVKEASGEPQATSPKAIEATTAVRTQLDAKITQLESTVSTAEADLAAKASSADVRGEVLENIRQELGAAPGGNPPELDQALGKAADNAIAANGPRTNTEPRVGIANNHLELTSADAERLRAAVVNGDFEEASDALANTFDRRNYKRMSSPEGIKDIIAGMGHEFAEHENSLRLSYRRTLDETERLSKSDLELFAKENNGDPEAIATRFKELFPDLELDRALTSYRMFEAGLAKKLDDTADLLSVNPGDKIAQDEFARLSILLANVNDHLSGVTSAFGRAQSAGRIEVSFDGVEPLLSVQRRAMFDEIDKAIEDAGGSDKILKAAEAVRLQKTRRQKRQMLRKIVERQANSIGDISYSFVATNLLSSPPTHTTNVIGPLARVLLWDPAAGITAGGLNMATGGGTAQFAREIHFAMAKWRNAVGALDLISAVKQASPLQSGIARAFRTGQRITAAGPNANTMMTPGERNSLRAIEIAKTARAGVPMHVPFSGYTKGGPSRIRLLGSLQAGPKLGDALQAQAEGNLRLFGKPSGNAAKDIGLGYGVAAKVIDYAGRVQSWPRHLIATGDELVAGISYRAKLEADAYAEARSRGLTGKDFQDFVSDVVDNAASWTDIAKTVDTKDMDAVARVELLSGMDKSANNYVDEATFTQPPGFFTNKLLEFQRRMPAMRWFTFFARTGAAIGRTAYNTSLPGSIQQLATAATREDRSLAAAKVAINTAIAYKVFEGLSNGHITGSGPINKAERDIWLETHEPYSIWVQSANDGKGAWVSYARLDPFATQIQVMAEFADALSYTDDAQGTKIAGEIMTRMGRLIGSKTYLQGISDFLSLLGGEKDPADIGIQLAKDFIPQSAALRNIRRAGVLGAGADPVRPMIDEGQGMEINDAGELVPRREGWVAKMATQVGSSVQAEVPGPLQDDWADLVNEVLDLKLDRRAYPQRDFFGNVTTYPPAFGPDNFSGIVKSEKAPDPVVDELLKQDIGFNIKERLGVIRGVELSPEQMDYFHQQFGFLKGSDDLHTLLAKRIASEQYQRAGSNVPGVQAKAGRRKILESVIRKREKAAEQATIRKFDSLRAQIAANAEVQRKMQSQAGSNDVRAEVDVRKSNVLKALQEKLE